MFFRRTTHAPISRTALRAGAAAFAVGIIGAGLMTTGASAETDNLNYTCTSQADDGFSFDLSMTVDSGAPESAEEGEHFSLEPMIATGTVPQEAIEALQRNEIQTFSGAVILNIFAVPEGQSQGDKGAKDGKAGMQFDSTDVPEDPTSMTLKATSADFEDAQELEAWGTGADSLKIEAGDFVLQLGMSESPQSGYGENFDCELADGQDPVIDTVQLTEPTADPGNQSEDESEDPNANVPTAVNGGL